ncbi:MAG: GNAT family N-acetyltransferase [Planctomycetota bacterium]|jgi:ribosomal protein S18 acetylase RimI-like enzyme
MSTFIRRALHSDLSHLIALSRRTIGASYRPFLGDEAVDAFIGSGAADRYVEENIGRCSVILRDEQVVGYAVWRDNLIDLLMIDHAVHRQGLGTLLLQRVEAALFERYEELRLESFEGNRSANAFYRKNGWREVGRRFDETSGSNKILFGKPT